MSKSISRKILYVVVALAMLAMMIPMAIPVSAAGGTITMMLVAPTTTAVSPVSGSLVPEWDATHGYNITGSTVQVSVTGDTVTSWTNTGMATITGSGNTVTVASNYDGGTVNGTESVITAHMADNTTLSVDKKWANISYTQITSPGSSYVTWNEAGKSWSNAAPVNITDTVYGNFVNTSPASHVVEGAILNWYLVPGNWSVPMAAGEAPALKATMLAASNPGPSHVSFTGDGHNLVTVTDRTGSNTVGLTATGEEAVQVVVIPEYPGDPQILVTPEVTSWDFFTTEMETVPQVRWAGEKIVLEKYFGTSFDNTSAYMVKFSLQNQSVGSLEGITGVTNFTDGGAVWTPVVNGFASVILVSSDTGVSNVTAGLYSNTSSGFLAGVLTNQAFFTTYWLKFESLSLGDVQGKRTMHDAGPWEIIPQTGTTPGLTNPWDPSGSYGGTQNPAVIDNTTQTLNVSQDALLRARVRGWFTSSNPSWRPEKWIDPFNASPSNVIDAHTPGSLDLPAGRWVLPDDWATLAGPNWQQSRMHWDIMCNPDGSVLSVAETTPLLYNATKGNYYIPPVTGPLTTGTLVGKASVIGPFSPGLELMTPAGWEIANAPLNDPTYRPIHTVVPDGNLNPWDAPMPSAKIIFQIQNIAPGVTSAESGYFKATAKGDVYFVKGLVGAPTYSDRHYTNPFYYAYIPAHEAIPAFILDGGYDWNSYDPSYGPYMFWQFINQNKYTPLVASVDPANHPTAVEVYSDNHGEAMVWLNGNWNLNLAPWLYQTSTTDIPTGTIVGTTTIQATADYPYSRLHQAIQSNMDTKTWTWGQQVLGTDTHLFADHITGTSTADTRMVLSVGNWLDSTRTGTFPNEAAKSTEKMVWVWITDRDGMRDGVSDAVVTWTLGNIRGATAKIAYPGTGMGISNYNDVTQNIGLVNGFLAGTNGVAAADLYSGTSKVIAPDQWTTELFNKFWGSGTTPSASPNPARPGTSNIRADVNGYMVAGLKIVSQSGYAAATQVNIQITSHDFDTTWNQTIPGSVSYSTVVDFNIIDALDDGIRTGDANCDGYVNMGDVTAVERMILGYTPVTSNAILNNDGSVDMGTVVKIERNILGLK